MSRFSPAMRPPPVRISRANARVTQSQMLPADLGRTSRGAGNYGQRERRFASVPIRLRIQSNAGPNTAAARAATIPLGTTVRKRGYPPISLLPTAQAKE